MILGTQRSRNNSLCKLNLRGDGSNGGTTFTDSSPSNRTATRLGTAIVTSTSYKKFGTASLYNNTQNANNGLSFPDDSAWDIGNNIWAVEAWLYTVGTNNMTLQIQINGTNYHYIALYTSTTVTQGVLSSSTIWNTRDGNGANAYNSSSFTHFYVECNGSAIQIYKNGVKQSMTVTANPSNKTNVGAALFVMAHPSTGYSFNGYVDGYKFYKGARPYKRNFKVSNRAA